MSRMRFVIKGARLGLHILHGLALAVIYPVLGATAQGTIHRWWSKTVLAILDVQLRVRGAPSQIEAGGVLLVANHISWLDVFAVNAVRPTCFVAKSEVARWPVIGTLCKQVRTIFISRARRGDTVQANQQMAARLAQGEWVAVFPEGTSTDGTDVAPFHSSLFQSAIEAVRPVVPVTIQYEDGYGNPTAAAAFIGDMTFLQSLVDILGCGTLVVSLDFAQPLDCAGKRRQTLAAEAHAVIAGAVRQANGR